MSVRVTTHLETDGSGRFTLAVSADKELRDELAASTNATQGLSAVEDLFERLRAKDWVVTRSEPGGGLALRATKTFADARAYDAVLADVRTAPGKLGEIGLDLSFATKRSLLNSRSEFRGRFDTSRLKLDRDIVRAVQGLVKFEIVAELPGDITVGDGSGTVATSGAVWRPDFGSALSFSATSSALRAGTVMMIVGPVIALFLGLGLFAFGRRRHDEAHTAEPPREPVSQPVYTTFHPDQIGRTIHIDPEPIILDAPSIVLPEPAAAVESVVVDE